MENATSHAITLPAPVRATLDAYLEEVKNENPLRLEGLYLVGSVALDDFQPHSSDIDFVAVTAHRPQPAELAAWDHVHARLQERRRRPFFDGIYVTWDDLARDPMQIDPGPSVHEGLLDSHSRGERNPVTWHTLAQRGICRLGPHLAGLAIWTDAQRLAAWTDRNLDHYWRRLLDPKDQLYWRPGMAGLTPWACAWCVLGVSRLHYTLATGRIASKRGAGLYALETFPGRWQPVIEEALRIRCRTSRRSLYRSPLTRRRDVHAFAGMVIADSHDLYATTQSRDGSAQPNL